MTSSPVSKKRWLLVALGNPEPLPKWSRHSVGLRFAGFLSRKYGFSSCADLNDSVLLEGRIGGGEVFLAMSRCYMNRSGEAVKEALSFLRIDRSNLIVIHDDVDLALGRVKLQHSPGSAGHKGVEDVISALESKQFWRLRIGTWTDRRQKSLTDTRSYVLEEFRNHERDVLEKKVFPQAAWRLAGLINPKLKGCA